MTALTPFERSLIAATQAGLPLAPRPFLQLAEQLKSSEVAVLATFKQLAARQVLRRIAAVPDHYKLGYTANAMTVWDVADEHIATAGPEVAALASVSHCYQRPRQLPTWPYNLFAMVHGRDRNEVETKIAEIAALLGKRAQSYDRLYSTRILKKTGLRLKTAREA